MSNTTTYHYTEAHLHGTLVGQKRVSIDLNGERDSRSLRRNLRHIVTRACADGDFQGASFTGDSVIVLKRIQVIEDRKTIKVREIPLKKFKSVRDCIAIRRKTWEST